MTHTIKIPENDLKRIIARYFTACEPENVWFGLTEGQKGEKIIYATITIEEEI